MRIPEIEDPVELTGKLLNKYLTYDHIISLELQLHIGDYLSTGKLKRRELGPDGTVVSLYDDNPVLK